jgi:glycopeptide antibiotics resistance protein
LLAAVVFVTLSPIGLRPMTSAPPNVERFVAFAVVGFGFALSYPRHLVWVLVLIAGAAVGLELLQMLAATRHARALDVGFKILGGVIGVGIGAAVTSSWVRRG